MKASCYIIGQILHSTSLERSLGYSLCCSKFTFLQDKMAQKEMKSSAYKILRGICGVTKWTNWHNSKKNQRSYWWFYFSQLFNDIAE